MFDIIKGIGGAIGEAVGGIFSGIDKISTTEEEKLTLKTDILRIQAELELELARLGMSLAQEQASVIKTEIADGGVLGRSWRPIIMLGLGFVVIYAAVISPIFGFPPPDMAEIPDKFWTLITIGVGGYVTGRTVEKITPAIADAYKGFKDAEGDIMVVEGDMIEDSPTDRKRHRGK